MLGGLVLGAALAVVPAPARAQAPPVDSAPLCGVAQPAGGPQVPDDGALRIVSLNLLHSETDAGDESLGARLPLLADAIVVSGADVVGAQEVTRNLTFNEAAEAPQRHGLVAERLATEVAARTGEPWSWCWSLSNPHVPGTPDLFPGGGNPLDAQAAAMGNLPDGGDFSEGLAVLSRFPIERASFRRLLPRSYEAIGCLEVDPFCQFNALFDSRQVLFARIDGPDGGLDVFTTHVAHHLTELSESTRLLQVQQIAGIIDDLALPDAWPDVLVGDFNSTPSSAVMASLTEAGFVDGYLAGGGEECGSGGVVGCSGGPADGAEVWTDAAERPMSDRIDYVLLLPPPGCDLSTPFAARIAGVPQALDDGRYLWPSDHYGFVVETACAPPATGAEAAPPSSSPEPAAAGGGTRRLPATGGELPPAAVGLVAAALAAAAVRTALRRRPDPVR